MKMDEERMGLAELRNLAMGFDRAQMRDVHIVKDGEDYLSKRHMGVWNLDKNELACLAPKSYMVIQHRHAVECLIEALSSLNINAQAELKQSKHCIQIDFDFPESKLELSEVGESFTTGIRVVSDYSQVAGLVIAARVTRLACSNGMIVNDIVKPRRIKYTEELKVTVEGLIDKIIKDIITSDEKLANIVSICMRDSVEWQALRLLTKALFQKKCHVKEILARVKSDEDGRITRWGFYNAVTNYVSSSGGRLKPQVDAWLQNKAQKILATPIAQLTEEWVRVEEKKAA
jgi:predicted transcriptional regulator